MSPTQERLPTAEGDDGACRAPPPDARGDRISSVLNSARARGYEAAKPQ